MLHYSLGDSLRSWMRENHDTLLAAQIRDRLDNQGFLTSEELFPFLQRAIFDAICDGNGKGRGVINDGFPRCTEQLENFDSWVVQDKLPILTGNNCQTKVVASPNIVLMLEVTEDNAGARYLRRGRDANDSQEKFEKRFAEYRRETSVVEEAYRQRGILIQVSVKSFLGKQ